jgi:hypothetical protein
LFVSFAEGDGASGERIVAMESFNSPLTKSSAADSI